jgi:hypothetical protein
VKINWFLSGVKNRSTTAPKSRAARLFTNRGRRGHMKPKINGSQTPGACCDTQCRTTIWTALHLGTIVADEKLRIGTRTIPSLRGGSPRLQEPITWRRRNCRNLRQRESVSSRWHPWHKTFGLHGGLSAEHRNAARNYSRRRRHMWDRGQRITVWL